MCIRDRCRTVQIWLRDNELFSYTRQGKLIQANRTADDISRKAFKLYKKNHTSGKPIRGVGVRACDLIFPEAEQLSLIPDLGYQKVEELETIIDNLRNRFGHYIICNGITFKDKELSTFNPKEEHIIYPSSFLRGR